MPPRLHVARVGPEAASALAAIHRTCFTKPWGETEMAQFLASPAALCLLGWLSDAWGERMAGLLIARQAVDEAELLTIGVAPACRKSGLGRALVEAAAEWLRESGAGTLFLEVDEHNQAALALYRSLGAKPVGKRARYYEDGADAVIFSLALSSPAADDGP